MRIIALTVGAMLTLGLRCDPEPNLIGMWAHEDSPIEMRWDFHEGGKFVGTFRTSRFDGSSVIEGRDIGVWTLSKDELQTDLNDVEWSVSGWDQRAVNGIRADFAKMRESLIAKHRGGEPSKLVWIHRDRFKLIDGHSELDFVRVK